MIWDLICEDGFLRLVDVSFQFLVFGCLKLIINLILRHFGQPDVVSPMITLLLSVSLSLVFSLLRVGISSFLLFGQALLLDVIRNIKLYSLSLLISLVRPGSLGQLFAHPSHLLVLFILGLFRLKVLAHSFLCSEEGVLCLLISSNLLLLFGEGLARCLELALFLLLLAFGLCNRDLLGCQTSHPLISFKHRLGLCPCLLHYLLFSLALQSLLSLLVALHWL